MPSRRPGPWTRFLAWTQDQAPWLHRFLTDDESPIRPLRNGAVLGVMILLAVTLLWGGTGQPLGEAPVVVIESGSMMHCAPGSGTGTHNCEAESFGRLPTIDPGDLIFVRDIDTAGDVATLAEEGSTSFGAPGDVIIYERGGGLPPIIHRAMFWIDIHGDGTYSIDALGISHSSDLDHPALTSSEARERFGLNGNCRLFSDHARDSILDSSRAGWITKGDNVRTNPCWDQGGNIYPVPVEVDQVLGKARGQVPWIGLLKLWVFDFLQGTDNYRSAPADLRTGMWVSLAAVIGIPYGVEFILKRRAEREEDEPPDLRKGPPPGGR